jgi:SAM-dependent methyltransferase
LIGTDLIAIIPLPAVLSLHLTELPRTASGYLFRSLRHAVTVLEKRTFRALEHARLDVNAILYYSRGGEATNCPGCGSRRIALLGPMPLNGRRRGRRFGFMTGCRQCGLVFADPAPSADALRTFYSPSGEWGRARDEDTRGKAAAPDYLLKMFGAVRSWVDVTRPPRGGRVLDVGCGSGGLLDFFASYGWETNGIDPADKRAFPRHAELMEVPGDGSYDVTVLHHVLEHVAHPLDMLRSLRRALKPGGVLFISVPRLDALPHHRDLRYCLNGRTHIVAFTWDALHWLLTHAGFEAVTLNDPPETTLDRGGMRRLRVMARRVDHPVAAPPNPLAAARAALARHHAQATERAAPAWLPVRLRASLADRRR